MGLHSHHWGDSSRGSQGGTQRWTLWSAHRRNGELTEGWGPPGNTSPPPWQPSSVHPQLRAILKPGRNGQAFHGMMVTMFGSAQTQDGMLRVNDLDM